METLILRLSVDLSDAQVSDHLAEAGHPRISNTTIWRFRQKMIRHRADAVRAAQLSGQSDILAGVLPHITSDLERFREAAIKADEIAEIAFELSKDDPNLNWTVDENGERTPATAKEVRLKLEVRGSRLNALKVSLTAREIGAKIRMDSLRAAGMDIPDADKKPGPVYVAIPDREPEDG